MIAELINCKINYMSYNDQDIYQLAFYWKIFADPWHNIIGILLTVLIQN